LLLSFFPAYAPQRHPHSFPTRRSSDLSLTCPTCWPRPSAQRPTCPSIRAISPPSSSGVITGSGSAATGASAGAGSPSVSSAAGRSEEHTSELQSRENLVCRLLLEKKKT